MDALPVTLIPSSFCEFSAVLQLGTTGMPWALRHLHQYMLLNAHLSLPYRQCIASTCTLTIIPGEIASCEFELIIPVKLLHAEDLHFG